MIDLTAAQLAQITGGRAVGAAAAAPVVRHVATDSREARPGTLFVAKPGEVTDGHEYVGAAFAAGAVLALVEHEVSDAEIADAQEEAIAEDAAAEGTDSE